MRDALSSQVVVDVTFRHMQRDDDTVQTRRSQAIQDLAADMSRSLNQMVALGSALRKVTIASKVESSTAARWID